MEELNEYKKIDLTELNKLIEQYKHQKAHLFHYYKIPRALWVSTRIIMEKTAEAFNVSS